MRKPCCEKKDTNKGAWSRQEDQKLIDYIQKHGEGCWSSLPQAAGLRRCGKSCRLRWINYLRPDLKRGNFGEDEEDLIIKLHALLGNRWSLIAGRLPGRTDNEVKNYWNSHIRKKLIQRGLDPNKPHRLRNTSIGARKSSESPNDQAPKPVNFHGYKNLKVNNDTATSSDSNKTSTTLPDINLDLTLCTPAIALA
ncbi:transcription factor MYB3 [Ziziphus jujuba]|uniref:Transcription factor MYB3 n=2 Tax=Ziziphus jujuba TaxID=326968 RepID=A0ABM3IJP0_ZIZJJ|nr:transcription factor MYB3 [Ziziphus jujuba]KAH7528605.1 hypothetical protein FEM48_Zijuj05G0089700 [Ziziphus jujuba var. spinosa]